MVVEPSEQFLLKVLGTLNEAQARWYVAREALARGRGGVQAMHELTGLSRPTILKGMRELREHKEPLASGRIRQPGGGPQTVGASGPRL